MSKQIPLTGKLGQGKFALVDDCDFDRTIAHSWYVTSDGYARSRISGKRHLLHRFVLRLGPNDPLVDHVNLDKLDCRQSNLRIASRSQNRMNMNVKSDSSTGVKGVTFCKGRYIAHIRTSSKRLTLGRFSTILAAAMAYNDAAIKEFGEFARLNDLSALPLECEPPKKKPTSPYRGVFWNSGKSKWTTKARIGNGNTHHIGHFATENEAARAYDAFVKEHDLDRPLNFPD